MKPDDNMQASGPSTGKPFRKVVKNAAFLGAARVMRAVVRSLYMIVLARYLGPALFGVLNYGMAWYLIFLSTTDLGLDLVLSRRASCDGEAGDEVVLATLRLQVCAGLVAALACSLAGVWFEAPELHTILAVFSFALFGRSVAVWSSFVFVAKQGASRVFWIDSTCRIAEAIAGSAVLVIGGGLTTVVFLHALVWWLQAAWTLAELVVRRFLRFDVPARSVLTLLGFVPVILGFASVFQVWLAQAPVVMFRQLGGNAKELGEITLMFQVFGLLAGISWMAIRAITPALSRNVTKGGSADLVVVNWLGPIVILVAGAMAALAVILGQPLLVLLVGSDYGRAARFLPLAIAAAALYAISVAAHQILAAHQKYLPIVVGTCAGAATTTLVMLGVWQVSHGFAPIVALLAGLGAWIVIVLWSVRMLVPFSVRSVIGKPLAVAAAGVAAAYMSNSWGPGVALLTALVVFGISTRVLAPYEILIGKTSLCQRVAP